MKRIVCIGCYWFLVDKRDAAKGGRLCKHCIGSGGGS